MVCGGVTQWRSRRCREPQRCRDPEWSSWRGCLQARQAICQGNSSDVVTRRQIYRLGKLVLQYCRGVGGGNESPRLHILCTRKRQPSCNSMVTRRQISCFWRCRRSADMGDGSSGYCLYLFLVWSQGVCS